MPAIAIDVMSGDHPPPEYVSGALAALGEDEGLHALLVGAPDVIEPRVASLPATLRARVEVVPASEVVAMLFCFTTPTAQIARQMF